MIVIFIYRRFIKCIHDFAYFIMDRELKHYNYLLVTESYLIQVRGFPEESDLLIPPFFLRHHRQCKPMALPSSYQQYCVEHGVRNI